MEKVYTIIKTHIRPYSHNSKFIVSHEIFVPDKRVQFQNVCKSLPNFTQCVIPIKEILSKCT